MKCILYIWDNKGYKLKIDDVDMPDEILLQRCAKFANLRKEVLNSGWTYSNWQKYMDNGYDDIKILLEFEVDSLDYDTILNIFVNNIPEYIL